MGSITATVFVRRGCHLCEDMVAVLREFADELCLVITTIDVDRDPTVSPEQLRHYNALVPVLCVEGHEVCHHFLDLEALKAVLQKINGQ